MAVDCFADLDNTITITVGDGQTTRVDDNIVSSFVHLLGSTQDGAALVTMDRTWDTTGIYWGIVAASIKPAGTPPTGPTRRRVIVVE